MPGLLRVAFIAYEPSQIVLTTDRAIQIVFLEPNGLVKVWKDISVGTHTLDIVKRGVYGFTNETKGTLVYDQTKVTDRHAPVTDPWPDPPPAAPLGYNAATFLAMFNNFLHSSGGAMATTQLADSVSSPG